MPPPRSAALLLLVALLARAAATGSPWVYSDGAPVQSNTIRITTLGSGSPDVRKEQLASGFLVEVGNGEQDKFIFDLGTGAFINLWATGVPLSTLTKVFLTHLHSDHHADLATLYVGAMFGRKQPWEVWGPSAATPELGTAAAIEGLRRFMAWDTAARRHIDLVGRKDDGDKVIAREFDFSKVNQVVYKRNGVTIRSTPVSHYNTSGPVAYRLDFQGISFTYSGDTRPVPELTNLAKGTDVLILQNMGPIEDLAALSYESQLLINTSHITPQQAGVIFQDVKPRLGVAHHLTVNAASRAAIIEDIREGYPKGPIIINEDLTVYEITKEKVEVKKRLVPPRSWGYWHAESNWQAAAPAEGAARADGGGFQAVGLPSSK
ncbi:ribonuclease Z [Monoraphidium neglectum]|uniref:Ribonuclease Z n=1 Tax=Monoraphidium neglectum TaxID=145388 RepID=A0A0D2J688_9CHLO|nr:ribonuclease Z [Monoraphidium neglectum]KIY95387.1 ribonuclease Z [Monoraphidium neglectum]|eukprot:XP_013894407.1 ribonuclease Z [Monoraphidium neglectum]